MKKLTLVLSTFLFVFNLNAKTVVLSDVDDTLKVAHVRSTIGKLLRAFNTKVKFTGMPELFHALDKSGEVSAFYYLSNAPKSLMGKSHPAFLKNNNFPTGTIWLRDDLSSMEHKPYHLRELVRRENPTTIILFGDNGEYDAKFYADFGREFPHIRLISFIRYLYAEAVEATPQNEFVTALGPYLTLKDAGLIKAGLKEEEIIARQILVSERDGSYDPVVFPSFLNCPGYEVAASHTASELVIQAAQKVARICDEAPFYLDESEDLTLAILSGIEDLLD